MVILVWLHNSYLKWPPGLLGTFTIDLNHGWVSKILSHKLGRRSNSSITATGYSTRHHLVGGDAVTGRKNTSDIGLTSRWVCGNITDSWGRRGRRLNAQLLDEGTVYLSEWIMHKERLNRTGTVGKLKLNSLGLKTKTSNDAGIDLELLVCTQCGL